MPTKADSIPLGLFRPVGQSQHVVVDGRLRGHDVEWVALARISSWPRMITDEIAKIVEPEAVNVGLSIRARRNPLTRMALNRLASCRG